MYIAHIYLQQSIFSIQASSIRKTFLYFYVFSFSVFGALKFVFYERYSAEICISKWEKIYESFLISLHMKAVILRADLTNIFCWTEFKFRLKNLLILFKLQESFSFKIFKKFNQNRQINISVFRKSIRQILSWWRNSFSFSMW